MSNPNPPSDDGTLRLQPELTDRVPQKAPSDKKQHQNKHYFISYLAKKRNIANNIRHNEERTSWKYDFTAKIINPKRLQFNGKDIFNSLKTQFAIDLQKIKSITQSKSKKVWLIEFKEADEFNKTINNELVINSNKFNLLDANTKPSPQNNTVTLKAILRFHWLPPNFDTEKINNFLKNRFCNTNIKIEQIEKEHFQGEMSHIENGVIRVKVEYPLEENDSIISLIGRAEIDSFNTLIQLNGYPPRCRHCDGFEHPAKECPKQDLKCTNCNGKYHVASQCNLAKKLKQALIQKNDSDDELDDEELIDDENENETDIEEQQNSAYTENLTKSNTNLESLNCSVNSNIEPINKRNSLKHSASVNNINMLSFAIPTLPVVTKTVKPNQAKNINAIKTISSSKRQLERTSLDNTEARNIRQRAQTDSSNEKKLDEALNLIEISDTITLKPSHPFSIEQERLAKANTNNKKCKNAANQVDKQLSKSKPKTEIKPKETKNN